MKITQITGIEYRYYVLYIIIIIINYINLALWRTLRNVIQTQKCVTNKKN